MLWINVFENLRKMTDSLYASPKMYIHTKCSIYRLSLNSLCGLDLKVLGCTSTLGDNSKADPSTTF